MIHETLGLRGPARGRRAARARTGFRVRLAVNGKGLRALPRPRAATTTSRSRACSQRHTQHLYEADDHGVDVRPGEASTYEIDEGDEDDRGDLEGADRRRQRDAAATGRKRHRPATADLGEMTRISAGEQYIGHSDGYSVRTGVNWPNDYYLPPRRGRAHGCCRIRDRRRRSPTRPVPGAGQGVLITRCRGDASCLADFARASATSPPPPTRCRSARDSTRSRRPVAPWRDCPHLEQATDAGWQQAVKGTRQSSATGRIAVASYLGRPAPAPVPALESTAPPAISPTGCPFAPHPPPKDPDPDPEPTPTNAPPAAPPPPDAGGVLGATASSPRRVRPHRLTLRARRGARLRVSGALRAGRRALPRARGRARRRGRGDAGDARGVRAPRLPVRRALPGSAAGRADRARALPRHEPARAALGRAADAQASCPGSIRFARWKLNSPASVPRSASTGSSRIASWSPASSRSSTRPTKRFGQASSSGVPPGPGSHAHARELVDLVAGLAAEQLRQLRLLLGHEVHAEQLGALRDPVGAVLVREADEEARRVDARLGREADQAAGALAVRARGDDEHRVVEVADERVEGRLGHAFHVEDHAPLALEAELGDRRGAEPELAAAVGPEADPAARRARAGGASGRRAATSPSAASARSITRSARAASCSSVSPPGQSSRHTSQPGRSTRISFVVRPS